MAPFRDFRRSQLIIPPPVSVTEAELLFSLIAFHFPKVQKCKISAFQKEEGDHEGNGSNKRSVGNCSDRQMGFFASEWSHLPTWGETQAQMLHPNYDNPISISVTTGCCQEIWCSKHHMFQILSAHGCLRKNKKVNAWLNAFPTTSVFHAKKSLI